ncbi:hypothetical protein C8Q80DRAFT_84286 [Daedaleopsis nitida]|nr:hypothetical protein C8Q80DRAFT_84286 [Daedaleopsis nitida]
MFYRATGFYHCAPPRPSSPEHQELKDSDSGRIITEDKEPNHGGLPARSRTQPSRVPVPRIPRGFDAIALPHSSTLPIPFLLPTHESVILGGHIPSLNSRQHRAIPVRTALLPSRPRTPVPTCVICQEEIEETIIYTRCCHFLDVACLRTLYENAIRDEALYPPKCCQDTLDFDTLGEYLTSSIRDQYRRKAREYRTRDRVYCHDPACSSFLSGATAAPTCIRCTDCGSETCGCCKAQAHRGRACVESLSDEGMLDFAREQGWQRCPSCHHLVERAEGCYHMTCRCEKEFCYLCAAAWKTCACPRFMDIPDE